MSSGAAPQFVRWTGQTSNLDRCNRCGRPRSVHGTDWSCPTRTAGRMADAALITGSVAAVAGLVLRFTPVFANHQIPACLFLAGVVMFIAGLCNGGQRN